MVGWSAGAGIGAFEITRVEPRAIRDELVDLLWEHHHWPGSSPAEYLRLWEWRYRSLGDGEPLAWVARAPDDGKLVGHIAFFPRRFRLGGLELRGAAPGDVIVDRAWRRHGLGARLLLLPKQLVRKGDFDLVLIAGSLLVHRLGTRLGYHDLETLHAHVDLRRSGPALARRFAPATALGPLVDLASSVRRRRRQREARRTGRRFAVEPLGLDAVVSLDRAHWSFPPDRLVGVDSTGYLARRFLDDPFNTRQLFALRDRASGRTEGYVIVEYRGARATVCDCRVNAATLTEATAIAVVGRHLPAETEVYSVPVLPGSVLSDELRASGFVHRRPQEPPEARLHLMAFWRPEDPHAADLARLERWNLYLGVVDA